MKKLFKKVLIVSFVVLVGMGTSNVQTAVAEPSDVSSITSVGIMPDTPTKVANSILFLTQGQTLEFSLLDINGNPVNYGNYTDTVTITGPAYFINDMNQVTQKIELKVKNGKGKVTFYTTNYYLPGEITVTPHFRTLLNKSFTEKLYIPGIIENASQVVLKDQPQQTIFKAETLFGNAENPFLIYNLQAEDENNNPTATNAPSDLKAEVAYNGKPSTAVDAKTTVSENGTYEVALKLNTGEIQNKSDIPVGNYTVTITPKSMAKTTFAPLTEAFSVNAN